MLRAPEFEGWAEDGGSKFVQQLVARLPNSRAISDEMLRGYDSNIVGHWKHITSKRNLQGQTIYPLYFQYLGLLFTEHYLDRYFRDAEELLNSLNGTATRFNHELGGRDQIEPFTRGRLKQAGLLDGDRERQDAAHALSHPAISALPWQSR